MSFRNRYLAQVTVVSGIYRKATYGQIQGDYERLKLCRLLYTYRHRYVASALGLRIFERLIFVAQSVCNLHPC
jgi:hypothetical protein